MIAVIAKIDRRLLLAALVTLFVAFSFWFGSRIPNLDEKAMMGGDSQIESLGFNVVFEVRQSDPAYSASCSRPSTGSTPTSVG